MLLLSHFSYVQLFGTLWTVAHQAPLAMEFSRQECWSRLPCPPPGNLPHPGIKTRFPALEVDSFTAEPLGKPTRRILHSVQFSSVAQLCLTLQSHELQHARPPCPSPTPGAYSNPCPLKRLEKTQSLGVYLLAGIHV